MSTQDPPEVPLETTKGFVVRRKVTLSPEGSSPARTAPTAPERSSQVASPSPPPQPQVTFYADEVATRIAKLDAHALLLGQRFGIPSEALPVDAPSKVPRTPAPEQQAEVVEHFLPKLTMVLISDSPHSAEWRQLSSCSTRPSASKDREEVWKRLWSNSDCWAFSNLVHLAYQEREQVLLERRDGRWGLYYHRQPLNPGTNTGRNTIVPLKDAPLEVRQRFLEHSEDFFRSYLTNCRKRIESMKSAIAHADRTLAFLEESETE